MFQELKFCLYYWSANGTSEAKLLKEVRKNFGKFSELIIFDVYIFLSIQVVIMGKTGLLILSSQWFRIVFIVHMYWEVRMWWGPQ